MAGRIKGREGGKEEQAVATPACGQTDLLLFSGFFRKQSGSLEANTARGCISAVTGKLQFVER